LGGGGGENVLCVKLMGGEEERGFIKL